MVLLSPLLLGCPEPAPTERAPHTPVPSDANVLVVVIDDLGKEHLSFYGGSGTHTPVLDDLASEGLLFHRAYASPMCSATRATLLTGRNTRRHGVASALDLEWADVIGLPLEEETIPEMLGRADRSWDTSLVGKWHLVAGGYPDMERHPLDQGFAWAAGSLSNIDDPLPELADGETYTHWLKTTNGVTAHETTYATTDTTDDAIERISTASEPFYVHVAFNAPHAPIHWPPPELYDGPREDGPFIERYRATVDALDIELGRLFANIDPALLARTNVFVISDDGTARWATDPPEDPPRTKGTLYERGVNVPLLAFGPDITPGETHALVSAMDILPTIAEWAEVDVEVDGRSLTPILAEPSATTQDFVFLERFEGPQGYNDSQQAIVTDEWKLIRQDGKDELFRRDLDEYDNRLYDEQDVYASLVEQMEAEVERLSAP